ncbi:MAG: hypothetical protein R3F22_08425 [Lysobacteraceae bacterium]
MRPLRDWLLAGLLTLLPLTASAEPLGYAVAFDTLYRVDLANGQATFIGPVNFNDVDGLAFGPDGTLYGVADATAGSGSGISDLLIRIDTGSGAGTLIAPLAGLANTGPGGSLDYGLAFTCDGRMWASSDSTGQFWEVTPTNGDVRLVAVTGAPLSGLAANGDGLYGIGVTQGSGNATQQALYGIDPDTGVASRIGSLGVGDTLSGAGADFDANGVLWATLDSQPPDFDRASRIARIALDTGAATVIGSAIGVTDNISLRSLAIAPTASCSAGGGNGVGRPTAQLVPGPAPVVLVLLGALLLLLGFRGLPVSRG